jgi:6-pyruvoyltetrahydropterin/6-carboxytetrahydropterin synthase
MQFQLSQSFVFEAAHSLQRKIDQASSARIHGHSYRATLWLSGEPDPQTGMVTDLGLIRHAIASVHEKLDHRLLDEVVDLGPATLENLCVYIWQQLAPAFPQLSRIKVERGLTGDACELSK